MTTTEKDVERVVQALGTLQRDYLAAVEDERTEEAEETINY